MSEHAKMNHVWVRGKQLAKRLTAQMYCVFCKQYTNVSWVIPGRQTGMQVSLSITLYIFGLVSYSVLPTYGTLVCANVKRWEAGWQGHKGVAATAAATTA